MSMRKCPKAGTGVGQRGNSVLAVMQCCDGEVHKCSSPRSCCIVLWALSSRCRWHRLRGLPLFHSVQPRVGSPLYVPSETEAKTDLRIMLWAIHMTAVLQLPGLFRTCWWIFTRAFAVVAVVAPHSNRGVATGDDLVQLRNGCLGEPGGPTAPGPASSAVSSGEAAASVANV